MREGRKHTPEELEKMSAAHRGVKLSPEHRAAISAGQKGLHQPRRAEAQRGPKNHEWKGGLKKYMGYIRQQSPDHPYAKRGYVWQHRLVMEAHLGRVLLPSEVVHHINGKAGDNRIENLMLFSSKEEHAKYHHFGLYLRKKGFQNEHKN